MTPRSAVDRHCIRYSYAEQNTLHLRHREGGCTIYDYIAASLARGFRASKHIPIFNPHITKKCSI